MSKISAVLAAALLVGLVGFSRADDPVPPKSCANWHPSCAKQKCRDGLSFSQLLGWATYRPCSRECRGWAIYAPEPLPPLYTFFLHGYGEPTIITGSSCNISCKRCR